TSETLPLHDALPILPLSAIAAENIGAAIAVKIAKAKLIDGRRRDGGGRLRRGRFGVEVHPGGRSTRRVARDAARADAEDIGDVVAVKIAKTQFAQGQRVRG